jgi:hypothetical protein
MRLRPRLRLLLLLPLLLQVVVVRVLRRQLVCGLRHPLPGHEVARERVAAVQVVHAVVDVDRGADGEVAPRERVPVRQQNAAERRMSAPGVNLPLRAWCHMAVQSAPHCIAGNAHARCQWQGPPVAAQEGALVQA